MFKLMSHYIHYILSLVAISLLPFLASAQSTAEADSAYSQGDYSRAVLLYDSIARQKGVSSELLFNLGNAYARGGDYGNAMVSYLRALRIDPSNSHAKANVLYIESKVAENNRAELKGKKLSLDPDDPSFFSSIRNFIVRDHLSDSWALLAAIFFILFVACLAAYIYFRDVLIRKIGFFGGLSTLFLSVVMVVFSLMAASYHSNEGVILSPKVKLLSEASTSAKEMPVALTRGTRLSILDAQAMEEGKVPEWYKVRLNSDFVGWISAKDFLPIEP